MKVTYHHSYVDGRWTSEPPTIEYDDPLIERHRLLGHPSELRCRVAIAFYDLSRWV